MLKDINKNQYSRLNQDVDTSFLTLEATWRGIMDNRIKDQVGKYSPDSFCEIVKGTIVNSFMVASLFRPFSEKCAETLFNSPDLLAGLKQRTIKITNEMQEYAREVYEKLEKINDISDKEIADIFTEINKLQTECAHLGTVVAFSDVFGTVTNKLTEIVSEKTGLKNPLHTYTSVVGSPENKSLTEKANEDILANKDMDPEILLKKYFWLDQGYIGRGISKEQLDKVLQHKPEEEELDFNELLKELALSAEEDHAFQVSRDVIQIKALRADTRQFLHVVTNQLVEYLAKRWNIEAKYLETLYTEELVDILNNKMKLPNNLAERWQHGVLIPEERVGKYNVLLGKDAEDFMANNILKENLSDKKEIKGQTAQPGKAKGAVKLVLGAQHINKIVEGDILVSVATSPQLLPAMKKAAAFVTDVGGITSHAAIVSRELKKPCIVGTSNASQVLNDGDKIEVDADNGVVKILK